MNSHKSTQNQASSAFGKKGREQAERSFSEMLLSGEPMERRRADRQGKRLAVRPRPKRLFGRRAQMVGEELTGELSTSARYRWKAVLFTVFVVGVCGTLWPFLA